MSDQHAEQKGSWVKLEIGYVDPKRPACAFCGRPLASKVWQEAVAGNLLDFCDPDHVARYHSYWLPLYGSGSATSS